MRAVLACLADGYVRATSYRQDEPDGTIVFNQGDATALRGGDYPFAFSFSQTYRLIERPDAARVRLALTSYAYHVIRLDRGEERDLFGFHWHPTTREGGTAAVPSPHFHIWSAAVSDENKRLADKHYPTAFVAIADVARLLLTEFGVEPRRPTWEKTLAAAAATLRLSGPP